VIQASPVQKIREAFLFWVDMMVPTKPLKGGGAF